MSKRSLHLDLLHSGKYRQQVVKAKKGKGAYTRHAKHKNAINNDFLPSISAYCGKNSL